MGHQAPIAAFTVSWFKCVPSAKISPLCAATNNANLFAVHTIIGGHMGWLEYGLTS